MARKNGSSGGLQVTFKVNETIFLDNGRIAITLLDKPGRQQARVRIGAPKAIEISGPHSPIRPEEELERPPQS